MVPHALALALLSCALLGLRHGFDYDHLAAISDITGAQTSWGNGMRLGMLYAVGHAITVAVLGIAVIALQVHIPVGLDRVGERLVGATLIVLGVYVFVAWLRHRRLHPGEPHHLPSRVALLIQGIRIGVWRVRRLVQPDLPHPGSFRFRYTGLSVILVGVVHGLGAETPSQLLLFLLAANIGGTSRGLLGLLCFILGLLTMNALMTASAGGVFAGGAVRPRLQSIAVSITCAYSLIVGTIFLFGVSDRLPPLVR